MEILSYERVDPPESEGCGPLQTRLFVTRGVWWFIRVVLLTVLEFLYGTPHFEVYFIMVRRQGFT